MLNDLINILILARSLLNRHKKDLYLYFDGAQYQITTKLSKVPTDLCIAMTTKGDMYLIRKLRA